MFIDGSTPPCRHRELGQLEQTAQWMQLEDGVVSLADMPEDAGAAVVACHVRALTELRTEEERQVLEGHLQSYRSLAACYDHIADIAFYCSWLPTCNWCNGFLLMINSMAWMYLRLLRACASLVMLSPSEMP